MEPCSGAMMIFPNKGRDESGNFSIAVAFRFIVKGADCSRPCRFWRGDWRNELRRYGRY